MNWLFLWWQVSGATEAEENLNLNLDFFTKIYMMIFKYHFKNSVFYFHSSIDVRVLDVHQCKCATWNNPNLHRHELNICIYKPLRILYLKFANTHSHSSSDPTNMFCKCRFVNLCTFILSITKTFTLCLKHLFCINSIKILFSFTDGKFFGDFLSSHKIFHLFEWRSFYIMLCFFQFTYKLSHIDFEKNVKEPFLYTFTCWYSLSLSPLSFHQYNFHNFIHLF